MNIRLPYGTSEIPVDVPDNWINGRCYRSFRFEKSPNEEQAIDESLSSPMGGVQFSKVVANKSSAVIVVDSSCPQLFRSLLPGILSRIEEQSGVSPENLTILLTNSLWNQKEKSIIDLIPGPIRNRYPVVLHDPTDTQSCQEIGIINETIPVRVNKAYHESELRILLGPVMPDLIEGFCGARSQILPGIVDVITMRSLYNFETVGNKNVAYGITRDNPFHMAGMQAMQMSGADFAFCVLLTAEGEVAEIVSGDPGQATMASIDKLRDKMGVNLKEPMDIVVTTGGGAPYDCTFYHAIGVISAMKPILKDDATIVITSEMTEGFGPDPLRDLLLSMRSPARFEENFSGDETFTPGQWVAHRLFDIVKKHEVIVYCDTIPEQELWQAGLTPTKDVQEAIEVAMQGHGQRCKIAALPEGPFSIPQLQVAGRK